MNKKVLETMRQQACRQEHCLSGGDQLAYYVFSQACLRKGWLCCSCAASDDHLRQVVPTLSSMIPCFDLAQAITKEVTAYDQLKKSESWAPAIFGKHFSECENIYNRLSPTVQQSLREFLNLVVSKAETIIAQGKQQNIYGNFQKLKQEFEKNKIAELPATLKRILDDLLADNEYWDRQKREELNERTRTRLNLLRQHAVDCVNEILAEVRVYNEARARQS